METTAIDRTHTKALIYLALTEGLIEIDSRASDRRDEKILSYDKPNPLLKKSILEQVVYNPCFTTNAEFLERDWIRGDLINNQIIRHESIEKPEFSYKDKIPPSVIATMLKLKNSKFNLETGLKAFNSVAENYKKYEEYFEKKGKPMPEGSAYIKAVVLSDFNEKSEYSKYELEMKSKIDHELSEIHSFTSCFSDYFEVMALSKKVSGLFCVGTPTDYYNENIDYRDNQIKLYKLVVDEIGELPYRNSLKESLKLSKEPETEALREQLNIWTEMIFSGDIKSFEEIRNEIKKATISLSKRFRYNNVGKICTYIGVPASTIGLIEPLTGIAGLTISVVGAACTGYHDYLEDKYKYAMFGNK